MLFKLRFWHELNSTLQTSSQKLQKRFERGFLLFENCFIHFANSQFQLIYSVTTNNSFSHSRQRKLKDFLFSNKKELFKLVGKDWGGWVTLLLYFTSLKLRRLFSFFQLPGGPILFCHPFHLFSRRKKRLFKMMKNSRSFLFINGTREKKWSYFSLATGWLNPNQKKNTFELRFYFRLQ